MAVLAATSVWALALLNLLHISVFGLGMEIVGYILIYDDNMLEMVWRLRWGERGLWVHPTLGLPGQVSFVWSS